MLSLEMEIRLHRTKCRLSQTALGRMLGKSVTGQHVHHWEQDHYKPGPRYMAKVQTFLKADPAALRWAASKTGLVHKRKRPINRHRI